MARTLQERGQNPFYTDCPSLRFTPPLSQWDSGRAVGVARGAPGRGPQARPAPGAVLRLSAPPTSSGGAVKRERGGRPASPPQSSAQTGGMFPAVEEADRTVFVGNLEARVREEILYELFLQVPSVGKGRPRGRGALRGECTARGAGRTWRFGARPPSRPNLGPWF